ncbi:MAG TPA: ornithine cyclodeaminase family protein [Ilumatobacteraceae bacterium]|nr:ornithine cyclodeaminase family protein [Ilumatobacteraceae bacterium]
MIALMQSNLPYIDATELFRVVSLTDALEALRDCFAAEPTHVDRVHAAAGGGELLVMPAAAGDVAGVKLVGIQPSNPARGLPIIQGVYVLFDMRIGQAVALLDGAALTTLRTPMISALATDVLARHDVQSLGIIGTGPQAVAHVRAMRIVRPAIDRVVVAGRTDSHVARVVEELVVEGESATAGTYADAAACDIVCAATRADTPLFGLADVVSGAHINLVGSYRLDLREVAADLVAGATVVVDDLDAAKAEAGDLHLAVEEGVWSWDRVAGDLTDLANGRVTRTSYAETTLFKSVGLAVQDLVIARRAAVATGILEGS